MAVTNPTKVVEVSGAELELLRQAAARETKRKAAQRAYREARNAKPEVKIKNAEAHERRNARLKAFDHAFRFVRGEGWLTEEQMKILMQAVPEYAEFVELYETPKEEVAPPEDDDVELDEEIVRDEDNTLE